MADQTASFSKLIQTGYSFKSPSFKIGGAMLDKKVIPDLPVALPLRTLNRHGLISGATGTGKTKTLQLISEGLSEAGVPVMLMDIKGDLSGIAAYPVIIIAWFQNIVELLCPERIEPCQRQRKNKG